MHEILFAIWTEWPSHGIIWGPRGGPRTHGSPSAFRSDKKAALREIRWDVQKEETDQDHRW